MHTTFWRQQRTVYPQLNGSHWHVFVVYTVFTVILYHLISKSKWNFYFFPKQSPHRMTKRHALGSWAMKGLAACAALLIKTKEPTNAQKKKRKVAMSSTRQWLITQRAHIRHIRETINLSPKRNRRFAGEPFYSSTGECAAILAKTRIKPGAEMNSLGDSESAGA